LLVLSHISILGENPKIWYRKFKTYGRQNSPKSKFATEPGWVTASLLVQKLQAYPQKNALALVLQEYGRLVRTLHILRWYANQEDRRRILRQLNKGEALHDLRASLFIANRGQLRRRRGEELAHQASCLNLVTNAVMVWHTVYRMAVVEQLKPEGSPMQESDLAHLWPTRYNHIHVYGTYHFNIEAARG
jgi:TnpA family transposase